MLIKTSSNWVAFFAALACILLPQRETTALTIAEKKQLLMESSVEYHPLFREELSLTNETLANRRGQLKQLYQEGQQLHQKGAPPEALISYINEIESIKSKISETQKKWQEQCSSHTASEGYALWNAPDATLEELVMEYGSGDAIYLIPPEIANYRLSIHSNLPVPRESWEEILELILAQNGVGIRQINPYVKELYFLGEDRLHLNEITDQVTKLDLLPPTNRVCFVLTPDGPDPKRAFFFLQRFSSPSSVIMEIIGGKIFMIARPPLIKELLKIYEFAQAGGGSTEYRLITLSKIDPKEMTTILYSALGESKAMGDAPSFTIITLDHLTPSLFILGSKTEVDNACKMIEQIESQILDPKEKTVFWYTAKHSEVEGLADVLGKVYGLLVSSRTFEELSAPSPPNAVPKKISDLTVKPGLIAPAGANYPLNDDRERNHQFVIDPKTGSMIMVVEKALLPSIKDLLKRLDVPKKMVQIEVLLFEKKISHKNNFGLNLLRLGSSAANLSSSALSWGPGGTGIGILEFLISHKKGSGIPSYDLAYNFLLGQEDVQINASPSVTTVNQTPATIAIVEEISINTGGRQNDSEDKKSITQSYERAQYGITLQITPTINLGSDDEEEETGRGVSYITLDTDITFDTTKSHSNDRPDVTRRHIKNHVRIPDGQTVILGGLRRKNSEESRESIPFLGEIPGIGKLFGTQKIQDSSTEMFVFITPKIITDPYEEAEALKIDLLKKRPGDLPEFLEELVEARANEKKRLFAGTLGSLFGKNETPSLSIADLPKEYDGRE
ncbi:MAG: type II secretion system protein GspD [Chlamydiia bacterium]|nr:type II secretion system protein GspD [Chlamydiia bacterium]